MKKLAIFYNNQPEPEKSTFLALKAYILAFNTNFTEEFKYGLPFFYYKGKMCCYLWKDKKTREPYIGVANGVLLEHPALEQGNRKRMKILRINPNKDINVTVLAEVLRMAIAVQPTK